MGGSQSNSTVGYEEMPPPPPDESSISVNSQHSRSRSATDRGPNDVVEVPLSDDSVEELILANGSRRRSSLSHVPHGASTGLESFNYLTNSLGRKTNNLSATGGSGQTQQESVRTLDTLFGVFMPCVLSMFSLVLFLRVGIAVGQCGIYIALVCLSVGYILVVMTTLSICAISTNGEVQAGGAYFMISRTLGPEFGGALGVLFYISNVLSSGTYIVSMIEAVTDSFGKDAGSLGQYLPESYGYQLLYSTVVLVLCLLVCGLGGSLYAKSTFIIFIVVNSVIACVILNFFIADAQWVELPADSESFYNETQAKFTGISVHTFKQNDDPAYSPDYTTGDTYTFVSVFAIVFNGCTGILAGANLSGELKDPSVAIPKGTLLAQAYTYVIYALVYILAAFTCSTDLLQMNYTFLQPINFCPILVFIGTVLVTMSAALSAMIGASRILYAIAKDDVFGVVSRPFAVKATRKGNPYLSVLFTAFLVQLVLLIGNVNSLAPIVSIFFLMVYFFVNLACALLDISSAPNFRPTFKYFSWHVSFLGMLGCITMIFLISPEYAAGCLLVLVLLIVLISVVGPSTGWGSISQGLTFYIVRKFLLRLDPRKDHVKFWRPQILLLINNPKSCVPLMNFTNDLKKSGLYVIGHVLPTCWDGLTDDPVPEKTKTWLALVDFLQLKAFVEMTVNKSIREGILSLARLSGLGGLKPNTVIMGFYDYILPIDTLFPLESDTVSSRGGFFNRASTSGTKTLSKRAAARIRTMINEFPEVRNTVDSYRDITIIEYVNIIEDLITMNKNVCLARNFNSLDLTKLKKRASGEEMFIDVWLVDFFKPTYHFVTEVSSLFLLQLARILMMKGIWSSRAKMRVFIPSSDGESQQMISSVKSLLVQLRISAEVEDFDWTSLTSSHFTIDKRLVDTSLSASSDESKANSSKEEHHYPLSYFQELNDFIRKNSRETIVSFLYLPRPNIARFRSNPDKSAEDNREELLCCEKYMEQLEVLTKWLPPSLLVHGVSAVTVTSF